MRAACVRAEHNTGLQLGARAFSFCRHALNGFLALRCQRLESSPSSRIRMHLRHIASCRFKSSLQGPRSAASQRSPLSRKRIDTKGHQPARQTVPREPRELKNDLTIPLRQIYAFRALRNSRLSSCFLASAFLLLHSLLPRFLDPDFYSRFLSLFPVSPRLYTPRPSR